MKLEIHFMIDRYLARRKQEFILKDFGFATYTAPGTMYNVGNEVDELLLNMSISSIRMWHRTLSMLKRNPDPIVACTVLIKHSLYKDMLSYNSFFKAKKELLDNSFIIKTPGYKLFIVNIKYANKLFKPKLEV